MLNINFKNNKRKTEYRTLEIRSDTEREGTV